MKIDHATYPDSITLVVEHDLSTPLVDLVAGYGQAAETAGGKMAAFALTGNDEDLKPGSSADLHAAIRGEGGKAHSALFTTGDRTVFQLFRNEPRNATTLEASYPSESAPRSEWLEAMAGVARSAVQLPGFRQASLARRSSSSVAFVPLPPIARNRHLVTTTDAEVADAYEDPDFFWKVWDRVEEIGDVRLCIRGLDDLDETSWLARTFEDTMHLVRRAKPGKSVYSKPYWDTEFRPWWDYGDVQDEKAGYPALASVGYDEATKTVEMTGFITKTPLREGGPEPRHVLIREIYDVRALAKGKKDRQGRPVETVKITWPDEWMAMSERRPLLDSGARVFYGNKRKGVVEITS